MAAPPVPAKVTADDLEGDWSKDSAILLTRQNQFNADVSAALTGRLSAKENLGWQQIAIASLSMPAVGGAELSDFRPYAAYHATLAQSIPNSALTVINFDTVDNDSDSAVTTGAAWKFTVPASKDGMYHVSFAVDLSSAATIGGTWVSIIKNGSEYRRLQRSTYSASGVLVQGGSATLKLAAGDTVQVGLLQSSGGAQPLETPAVASTWITIQCVGFINPYIPPCFPLKFSSTLATGKASAVLPGVVMDITPGSVPTTLSGVSVAWHNETSVKGTGSSASGANAIVIDNIQGLLPSKTYSLTLWAVP